MAFTSAFPVIRVPLTARTSCPIFIPSATTIPTRFSFAQEVRVNLPATAENKKEKEKEGNGMATPVTYLYPIVSSEYDEFLLHSAPLPHLKEKDMDLWQSIALRSPTLYDPDLNECDSFDVDETWRKAAPLSAPIWTGMMNESSRAKISHRREYSDASSISTLDDEQEEPAKAPEDEEEMPSLVHSPKTPSSSGSLSPVSRAVTPSPTSLPQQVVHQVTDSPPPTIKEVEANSEPATGDVHYTHNAKVNANFKTNPAVSGCVDFFHAPLRLRHDDDNNDATDAAYLHARRMLFPPTRAERRKAGQKMVSLLMRRVNAAAENAATTGK